MQPTISLTEAAQHLGVHYMTAYRYVRTGRLPATKVGGVWHVPVSAIESFGSSPAADGRVDRHARLEERLLASDEAGAWDIVEGALASGLDPRDIHLQIITPALVDIGRRWEQGELPIADEHRATAVASRIIARLGPLFTRPGRRRGTIVIGAPALDQHAIPSAMAADLLRSHGFDVIDLGANTPAESFVHAAGDDAVFAIGICITTADNEDSIRSTLREIRSVTTVPIVVGGAAKVESEEVQRWGASIATDSAEAMIDAFETFVAERTRPASASGRG